MDDNSGAFVDDDGCRICFDKIETNTWGLVTPCLHNKFHYRCFKDWRAACLASQSSIRCPMCNKPTTAFYVVAPPITNAEPILLLRVADPQHLPGVAEMEGPPHIAEPAVLPRAAELDVPRMDPPRRRVLKLRTLVWSMNIFALPAWYAVYMAAPVTWFMHTHSHASEFQLSRWIYESVILVIRVHIWNATLMYDWMHGDLPMRPLLCGLASSMVLHAVFAKSFQEPRHFLDKWCIDIIFIQAMLTLVT